MATPRFSVLIPTRDRPATLRHTLATVLAQPGDDYEVVVADNCSAPESRRIVDELGTGRVRYTRSDEVLPMPLNWERGLALCTGDYITVLGDDDGFLPSTLFLARRLLDATSSELIAWEAHTYWWPDTIVPWKRHQLQVSFGNGASWIDSRAALVRFYEGTLAFGTVPMIYRGFFHRGLIEEAQRRYDGFFVPLQASPDIASAILGMHLTDRYIWSSRPLSVAGNSGKSNGTAHWARSLGAKQRETYLREERLSLQEVTHPALAPSPNLHVMVANAKLWCKETYFADDAALTLDLGTVLQDMLGDLGREPEAYDENLEDARALAAKIGARIDPAALPPKEAKNRVPVWGPVIDAEKRELTHLIVNTELAGIRHVADAARYIDALMPPADSYLEMKI